MNKKRLIQSMLAITAVLFLFGCAGKQAVDFPSFSAQQFDSTYQSKVDNFIIIFDASSSMGHDGKFAIAKAVTERMNLTIPELGQTAGLRSIGHADAVSKKKTELFYGMETYSTSALADKLDLVSKVGGAGHVEDAMVAMGADLEALSGKTAVVIISDGLNMENKTANTEALKAQYGDAICFYPIQVGTSAEGTDYLSKIASIGDCSSLVNANDILGSDGMATFVKNVFLNKVAPKPVVAAPAAPTPKDSDGDGVLDDEDQCPGTPAGAQVNAVGCWALDNVLFDFDKDVIKSEAYPQLDAIAAILEKNPTMSVELQGHTDNVGTEEYNMDLSMRRSNAVALYLVDKGIARNRMATTGFGFTKPVALNGTDFGRSLNRRVEIHPY